MADKFLIIFTWYKNNLHINAKAPSYYLHARYLTMRYVHKSLCTVTTYDRYTSHRLWSHKSTEQWNLIPVLHIIVMFHSNLTLHSNVTASFLGVAQSPPNSYVSKNLSLIFLILIILIPFNCRLLEAMKRDISKSYIPIHSEDLLCLACFLWNIYNL